MLRLIRTRVVPFLISVIATVGLSAAGCDNDSKGGRLQTNSRPPDTQNAEIEINEPAPSAQEREEALKVVDQAIKAHGGAERLAKIKAVVKKTTGFFGPADPFAAEMVLHVQFPDKIRNTQKCKRPDGEVEIDVALNGESGWYRGQGKSVDIVAKSADARDVKTQIYLESIETRLPLKEEGTVVRPLADQLVNGKLANGVRVKQKDMPALNLFFDAQTHLLVKLTTLVSEAGLLTLRDIYYYEHQSVDGVMLPKRLREMRAGAPFLEWTTMSYEFLDKIDEALLKEPKG